MEGGPCSNLFELASGNKGAWPARSALQTARPLCAVGPTFSVSQSVFRLYYSGYGGYVLLDLTELSSYLPLVSSFEFGNVSGDGGPRPRTTMTSAVTAPWGPSMAVSAPPGFASHLPSRT